jgi:hypothetical protein
MKTIRFCQELLTFFEKKNQVIVDLVCTLASNNNACSVIELANNPVFHYQYSSICDAINAVFISDTPGDLADRMAFEKKLYKQFSEYLLEKSFGKFKLLNTDVTNITREHSPTLKDKEYVHVNNTVIAGNKPIGIGYRVSTVGLSARQGDVAWNLPLSILKVPVEIKSNQFAAKQINALFSEKELFSDDLVVNALDSAYCNCGYIYPVGGQKKLVNIIRIASNRKVYHSFKGIVRTGKGAKNKYADVFKLNNPATHTSADKTEPFEVTLKNGRKCNVIINQWNNMLLRGKRNQIMYDKPFNLIAIRLTDALTGEAIFKDTLWLTVWGECRNELTLQETYYSYRFRFDIEFFFRFGKQRLLLDKFQTPSLERQQNWLIIVQLAYWILYLSRNLGDTIIHKWEKYLPKYKDQNIKELQNTIIKTPTQTQRAMQGIILEFTKKCLVPKTRNNSSGRKKGTIQTPRERFAVIKKGKKKNKKKVA